ncbi:MAG: lipopolysaccharide assembly protein LapB [Gammaproteobacteria bacterium]|nr:lipopolysaccharide assembly protein LapB [Gammaproteobacteria bacterium]
MQNLLWLLLPVAAMSGWFAARRVGMGRQGRSPVQALQSEYYKGINYLLNEQPDKAIDAFIRVLEVDSETVETHLALGNLYRRRGEVDRAIRIHQNLIARPTLDPEQRNESLLELAQDYLSAGLLDRAEDLFREISASKDYKVQGLRQLIDIYEQEKDWDKATEAARELAVVTGSDLGQVVAQYLCEDAERSWAKRDGPGAFALLDEAMKADPACARANLIRGQIHVEEGDYASARDAYVAIENQDADYLPETIERVRHCFEALGDHEGLKSYLTGILDKFGGMTATLALAELTYAERGEHEAAEFIIEQLRRRPTLRGFDRLLELELSEAAATAPDHLSILKGLMDKLMEDRPIYRCSHCGFPGRLLHWQCPGCKHWGTVRPVQGVEGE